MVNCSSPSGTAKNTEKRNPPPLDKKGEGGRMQPGKRSNHQKEAFIEIRQREKKPDATCIFLFYHANIPPKAQLLTEKDDAENSAKLVTD